MRQIRELAEALERVKNISTLVSWKKSTSLFAHESNLCTIDEHEPDEPKPFPTSEERPDIDWFWNIIDNTEDDLVIDKSRQHMISHAMRVAEMKLCLTRPNVKIALVFDDEKEANKQIEERIKSMFLTLPQWYKDRYTFKQRLGWFYVETCEGKRWNSYIEPIARNPELLRGSTYTWIVWEEMAKQGWAKAAYRAALPTIQGKRNPKTGKKHKGRMFAISTPIPLSFHEVLVGDPLLRDEAIKIAREGNIHRAALLAALRQNA